MLRGLGKADLSFSTLLPWASVLRHRLLYQKSLASLLWLIQRSQQTHSRILWYQTCFFFACLSKISQRTFYNLFVGLWRHSIFFFLNNQTFFFRTLEYYFSETDYLHFTPKFFRGPSVKPTTMMLPFEQFHLRAPAILYLTLWYHAEQIRMRFFNDYVKSHDFLNDAFYLPTRFRFQRTLVTYRVRLTRKQYFRHMFLKHSVNERYRVVVHRGLNLRSFRHSLQGSANSFPPFIQSFRLRLALASRKMPVKPLASIWQRYLLGVHYIQLNLWSNALLADDPWGFGTMVRMDWGHYLVSFPIFLIRFRLKKWFFLWSDRLSAKFSRQIFREQAKADVSFVLLKTLTHSTLPLKTDRRFYFAWLILDYRINRFWDYLMCDRWARVWVYRTTKTKAMMFPMNYQYYHYMKLFREVLKKSLVFGDFCNISKFFIRTVLPLDFLFWRISSGGGIYRAFLKNGAFSLQTFYRKLTLDHYAKQRYATGRLFVETVLRANGFFFTEGLAWQGPFNPWSLKKPHYRLSNGDYDPREPRWSLVRHAYSSAILRFVSLAFRRSPHLSIAAFFLVFDGGCFFKLRSTRAFQEIVATSSAYYRYYDYYRHRPLREYRRYPEQVFVISRTDPSFRARWFSFADRMRRAGIKRSDLPYYPENDDIDYVQELKRRAKKSEAKWNEPFIYWIVDESD